MESLRKCYHLLINFHKQSWNLKQICVYVPWSSNLILPYKDLDRSNQRTAVTLRDVAVFRAFTNRSTGLRLEQTDLRFLDLRVTEGRLHTQSRHLMWAPLYSRPWHVDILGTAEDPYVHCTAYVQVLSRILPSPAYGSGFFHTHILRILQLIYSLNPN